MAAALRSRAVAGITREEVGEAGRGPHVGGGGEQQVARTAVPHRTTEEGGDAVLGLILHHDGRGDAAVGDPHRPQPPPARTLNHSVQV